MDRVKRLFCFIDETLQYFSDKVENVEKDYYFASRDIRSILDKTINDIILCLVDIAEECLKEKGRAIPDSYRDTILSCQEFLGDIALKIAPLVRHRNEAIHQYLRVNWQNINAVKIKLPEIKEFVEKAKAFFKESGVIESNGN